MGDLIWHYENQIASVKPVTYVCVTEISHVSGNGLSHDQSQDITLNNADVLSNGNMVTGFNEILITLRSLFKEMLLKMSSAK